MRKHIFLAAAVALGALLGGLAVAQVPGLYLATLTGAETFPVRPISTGAVTTAPQITSIKVAQVRDAGGYLVSVPIAGATVQALNNASILGIYPAGTLATLTIALPTAPFDAQRVQIFSSQAITAVTMTSTASTIAAPVATLPANGSAEYFYVATTATWQRIQ